MPHSAVVVGRIAGRDGHTAYAARPRLSPRSAATPAACAPPRRPAARSPPRRPRSARSQCRTACMPALTAGHTGSRVRVQGTRAQARRRRRLPGRAGRRRRRRRRPAARAARPTSTRACRAPPSPARSRLVSADGAESTPPAGAADDRPDAGAARPSGTADGLGIDVEVAGQPRLLRRRAPGAGLLHRARRPSPRRVAVELVRLADGVAIARWEPGAVAPETPQTVTWDGTAGGKVQRDGRYAFRVFATSPTGATAASAQAPPPGTPASPPRLLPLPAPHLPDPRRPHVWAPARRAFGGGRGHQGHDVFANCGTPLVAARGGVVSSSSTTRRAGHYIVIDGDGTGFDYAYMHLRDASLVDQGDHVYTGQPIGFVGDTGRASGCHLHFESGRRRAGTAAASRSTRCRCCRPGTRLPRSAARRPRQRRRTSTAAGSAGRPGCGVTQLFARRRSPDNGRFEASGH